MHRCNRVGSYAIPLGDDKFLTYLNSWLQYYKNNGTLDTMYDEVSARIRTPASGRVVDAGSLTFARHRRRLGDRLSRRHRMSAAHGSTVVCADIDDVWQAAATSSAAGSSASSAGVDVTDAAACDDLVRATSSPTTDGFDALVTCAGIEVGGPAEELSDDAWRRVIDVNLSGTFWCAHAAGRAMIAAGDGGRIRADRLDRRAIALAGQAAYCSSKGGVAMLGAALAVDWGPPRHHRQHGQARRRRHADVGGHLATGAPSDADGQDAPRPPGGPRRRSPQPWRF